MKFFFACLCVLNLTGCGTVITLAGSEEHISETLRSKGTYCESITRVYSGAAYDFCTLHSRLQTIQGLTPFYLGDMLFSATVDTVVLPYSIYAQSKQGDIEIAHARD